MAALEQKEISITHPYLIELLFIHYRVVRHFHKLWLKGPYPVNIQWGFSTFLIDSWYHKNFQSFDVLVLYFDLPCMFLLETVSSLWSQRLMSVFPS